MEDWSCWLLYLLIVCMIVVPLDVSAEAGAGEAAVPAPAVAAETDHCFEKWVDMA